MTQMRPVTSEGPDDDDADGFIVEDHETGWSVSVFHADPWDEWPYKYGCCLKDWGTAANDYEEGIRIWTEVPKTWVFIV